VFGDVKENKGYASFLIRSLETVKTEFNVMSTANNLHKIWRKKLENIEKIKKNLGIELKKLFLVNTYP